MKAGWFTLACHWAAHLALSVPLALLVLTSLTGATFVGFPLGHFSLRWYAVALANPANLRAFVLSFGLALSSAALGIVAGTWIALAAGMLGPIWRGLLYAGTLLPLVTPRHRARDRPADRHPMDQA